MKKVIAVILAIVMVCSLVACGGGEQTTGKTCSNCGLLIYDDSALCVVCSDNEKNSSSEDTSTGPTFNENASSGVTDDELTSAMDYLSSYFENHKQTYSTCAQIGCYNQSENSWSYCSEHGCAKYGCTAKKGYTSDFCSKHECGSIGCNNASEDWETYCIAHACVESGCRNKKEYLSDYCTDHKCAKTICKERAIGYRSYCLEHKCTEPFCQNEKYYTSDYCIMHK